MDTTLSRPPAGQLLDGRYRVEAWLAHGGMATVYLGTDTRLDRQVALKIAHPELAGDEEFIRRFMAEARAVARLSSPNVVAVYDQGSDGQFLYLAMEYVPGRTLRELLRERGRLSPAEALDLIEGVLAGLAAAHEAGIVHRDVKPENVLLTRNNLVKVADFGLARAAAAGTRTKSGMIIGTAAYLAPEQVSRSTSDARTDVYAAGIMLFELLTGTQPHTGGTPLDVAYKHVNDVIPAPSSVVPGLPPALDALVALATSREPDLRPADARQFLHAITSARRGMMVGEPRPRGQHPARNGGHPGERGSYPNGRGSTPSGGVPDAGSADPATMPGPAADRSPADPRQHAAASWPDTRAALTNGGFASPLTGPAERQPGGLPPAPDRIPGYSGSGSGTNHTLIVSPVALNEDGHDEPDQWQSRRDSGYRRPGEPILQRLLFSRRLVYLAGGLAVLLTITLVTWWLADGRYATVPRVSGLSASVARSELVSVGFAVRTGPGQHSRTIPKGDIIQTSPAIGARPRRGSTVQLIVSLGPMQFPVPQVTGLALASAQTELKKAGLTPGGVTQTTSPTIANGIVISTNPVAGVSWPQTSPVAITVSDGPPLADYVGQQLQAAQSAATAAGYALNPVTDSRSTQPAGTITSQSPAPGTPVSPHEVVTVHVSSGPPMVPVPNVQGENVNQAEAQLTKAGFNVSVDQLGPGHKVIAYNPVGKAPQGSTITLNVGFLFSLVP
jgi:serine/threonine-protein kinase